MRTIRLTSFNFVLFFALGVTAAVGQEPFSIEPTPKDEAKSLPAPLRQLLDEPGVRLLSPVNGQNTIVVEVWWRRAVPLEKNGPTPGDVVYGDLKVGTLLGVLRFPPEASDRFREDFRDQKLKPGFYTMRYAQMPSDHAHKNANRYRDTLILSRVSVDTEYMKVLSVDEMLAKSRLASRSRHPAVLSLVPVRTVYKDFPKAIADNSGLCILQSKIHGQKAHGKASDLEMAVILVTPEVEEGGS
ncbi:MAG TPA: hypothetical protein VFA68_20860 [Terriglobales bacterium]|nr:hypothetical protein [Terriglobales bacterium]